MHPTDEEIERVQELMKLLQKADTERSQNSHKENEDNAIKFGDIFY